MVTKALTNRQKTLSGGNYAYENYPYSEDYLVIKNSAKRQRQTIWANIANNKLRHIKNTVSF